MLHFMVAVVFVMYILELVSFGHTVSGIEQRDVKNSSLNYVLHCPNNASKLYRHQTITENIT